MTLFTVQGRLTPDIFNKMGKRITLTAAILLCTCAAISQEFYSIERLPVSSDRFDDFSPVFYKNGIVFTSNRTRNFMISRLTMEGENFFNIYHAGKEEEEKWSSPKLLSRNLSSNYHDGPVSFSPDGNTIYFTRNIPANDGEQARLGIFISRYINGSWSEAKPFPYNSADYNVGHPSISDDGSELYFVSDMPRGQGGLDIYVCSVDGDAWGPPVNLGETVNSPGNEKFPFIHPAGRLYFSTDHNEKGNLDIYYTERRNNRWINPIALPGPFNSEYDDFGYVASDNFDEGYFSSNRDEVDNIYSFFSTFPVFSNCDSLQLNDYCFVFYEERGDVDTASFYFEWDMGDGTKIDGLEAEHCFDTTGTYLVRLNVIDKLTGEVMANKASYNFLLENIEQPYITSVDTAFAGETVRFDSKYTFLKNFQIDEYYWDMGDGTKASGEVTEHIYEYPGIYDVTLGVKSVPDPTFGTRKECVYKTIVIIEEK